MYKRNNPLKHGILVLLAILWYPAIGQKNKDIPVVENGKYMGIMPMIDGRVHYTEVVKVDSTAAADLYLRAKNYFVNAYRSANDVIQMDDKEQLIIIGKGFFKDYWEYPLNVQEINVYHTLTIACKDGRYKVDIGDLQFRYYVRPTAYTSGSNADYPIERFGEGSFKKQAKKTIIRVDKKLADILNAVRLAMSTPIVTKQNDW